MQSLTALVGQELVWKQRDWQQRVFDLYAGSDAMATITWENWSQTKAIAQIGDWRWLFEQKGFWNPQHLVSVVESGETVAVFKPRRWGYGGMLQMSDGRSAEFKQNRQGFWQVQWTWSIDNQQLMHFNPKNSWFKVAERVSIVAADLPPDALALMLTFGWYWLMKKASTETSATAAGAIAVAGD